MAKDSAGGSSLFYMALANSGLVYGPIAERLRAAGA